MNITYKEDVFFNNIELGSCFMHGGELYLKIDITDDKPNSFSFDTNCLVCFNQLTSVVVKNMELREI